MCSRLLNTVRHAHSPDATCGWYTYLFVLRAFKKWLAQHSSFFLQLWHFPDILLTIPLPRRRLEDRRYALGLECSEWPIEGGEHQPLSPPLKSLKSQLREYGFALAVLLCALILYVRTFWDQINAIVIVHKLIHILVLKVYPSLRGFLPDYTCSTAALL